MNKKRNLTNDAKLFLNFVSRVRETSNKSENTRCKKEYIYDSKSEKYKCIYCSCNFVYRKSLYSHMHRLHNIILD